MNKQQSGFTLIELVVVITLIGILAAVALPKFIGIQKDARASVMKGVAASMRDEAAMVYSKALIAGVEGKLSGTITVGPSSSSIATVYGYPAARAIKSSLLNLQPASDFTVTPGSTSTSVTYNKAATPASCAVTYTQSAAVGTAPTISVSQGGC